MRILFFDHLFIANIVVYLILSMVNARKQRVFACRRIDCLIGFLNIN